MPTRARARSVMAIALGLLLASPTSAAPPADDTTGIEKALGGIVATCAQSRGQVTVRRSGQRDWRPVATGTVFQLGDEIATGPVAFVRIELLSGGRFDLDEKSALSIDAATGAPGSRREARVKIGPGLLRGLLPAARSEAEQLGLVVEGSDGIPLRMVGAPGQRPVLYRITRDSQKSEIAVSQGQVIVTVEGHKQTVRSGQLIETSRGVLSAPINSMAPPQSLQPEPDAHIRCAPGHTVNLAWKPTPEATGYRVQVSTDVTFDLPEFTAEVEMAELPFLPPSSGLHAWRVASRDRANRWGDYGPYRRFYCE